MLKQFDGLLLQTLDKTIRIIFGESAFQVVHEFLERHAPLKRGIGQEVEAFCAFLEELLGSERAQMIYISSLRLLHYELQREYDDVRAHLLILDELDRLRFKLLISPGEVPSTDWN